MIKVLITRSAQSDQITSFEVSGHAGYAEPGKDIVCAAVSTVTVGTVNAICEVTGIQMIAEMRDGYLSASFPNDTNAEALKDAQLLLKGMLVMIQSIQGAYGNVGKFIQLKEKRS